MRARCCQTQTQAKVHVSSPASFKKDKRLKHIWTAQCHNHQRQLPTTSNFDLSQSPATSALSQSPATSDSELRYSLLQSPATSDSYHLPPPVSCHLRLLPPSTSSLLPPPTPTTFDLQVSCQHRLWAQAQSPVTSNLSQPPTTTDSELRQSPVTSDISQSPTLPPPTSSLLPPSTSSSLLPPPTLSSASLLPYHLLIWAPTQSSVTSTTVSCKQQQTGEVSFILG
jgi:hypothetical protein